MVLVYEWVPASMPAPFQGDLHPWEVATWESQYLVIHKRAKPAVLIYNSEVLPLKMCMDRWGRGPSCFLLSPGPMPLLLMVASAGLPQTTGEALFVGELRRWDRHPPAPQILSPWLVSPRAETGLSPRTCYHTSLSRVLPWPEPSMGSVGSDRVDFRPEEGTVSSITLC